MRKTILLFLVFFCISVSSCSNNTKYFSGEVFYFAETVELELKIDKITEITIYKTNDIVPGEKINSSEFEFYGNKFKDYLLNKEYFITPIATGIYQGFIGYCGNENEAFTIYPGSFYSHYTTSTNNDNIRENGYFIRFYFENMVITKPKKINEEKLLYAYHALVSRQEYNEFMTFFEPELK